MKNVCVSVCVCVWCSMKNPFVCVCVCGVYGNIYLLYWSTQRVVYIFFIVVVDGSRLGTCIVEATLCVLQLLVSTTKHHWTQENIRILLDIITLIRININVYAKSISELFSFTMKL